MFRQRPPESRRLQILAPLRCSFEVAVPMDLQDEGVSLAQADVRKEAFPLVKMLQHDVWERTQSSLQVLHHDVQVRCRQVAAHLQDLLEQEGVQTPGPPV